MQNAGVGSKHNLVAAKQTRKLRTAKIRVKKRQRFDVTKLKDVTTSF
jgi:hypothetical protein